MKTVLKIVLLCSVLVSLASATRAQTEDRLAAEKEEVIKLAKKFSERYEQTKTLEPLIGEFFKPNFNRNLPKSQFFRQVVELALDNLPESRALPLKTYDRQLLRRFYVGYTDAVALSFTWAMQFGCEDEGDNWKLRCDYPEDAKKLLRQNPLWGFLADDDDVKPISSERDLRRVTRNLELVNAVYRRHLRSFPANKTEQYLRHLARFEVVTDELFAPSVDLCDDDVDCKGRPRGSLIYQVTIPPGLTIYIAKVNGKLKILEIFPYMA